VNVALQLSAETTDRKYKDRDGRRFTFSEVTFSVLTWFVATVLASAPRRNTFYVDTLN